MEESDYYELYYEAWELYTKTGVAPWAHAMICIYFRLRPFDAAMDAYKRANLDVYYYHYREFQTYIHHAVWRITDDIHMIPYFDYILDKYAHHGDAIRVRDFYHDDKRALYRAFITQLGIYWTLSPITETEMFYTMPYPVDALPAEAPELCLGR